MPGVSGGGKKPTATRVRKPTTKASQKLSPKRSLKRKRKRHPKAKKRRKLARRSSFPALELERAQIGAEIPAEFAVFQSDLHRSLQEAEFIACVVGFAL